MLPFCTSKALALSLILCFPLRLAHAATSSNRTCTEYSIPVTVTSNNFIWGLPKFNNSYDVVDFITNYGSRVATTAFDPTIEGGMQNQTASYSIGATFCTPANSNAPKKDIVLLATHGIMFDRGYWDSGIQPEKYSFVDFAISQGYSILFYDRLGVGKSTLVSGYVAQAPNQIAILIELAKLVKAGKYTGSIGIPKSLVLVGHSFGSVISAGAVTQQPDIADGVVLTGFSYNGSNNGTNFLEGSQPRIAFTQNPLWDNRDTGYLIPIDRFAIVQAFFKKPDYDLPVVHFTDRTKQPFAINEFVTLGLVDIAPIHFKGVGMIVTGEFDYIFCQSQCNDVIAHPATEIFSQAKAFTAISYGDAGHGLNFAANALGAYQIITDYLGSHGL